MTAPTKPRQTHQPSGSMDGRSLTGPFFEVPSGESVSWTADRAESAEYALLTVALFQSHTEEAGK